MNGILVDTNVISELARDTPGSQIISFFVEHDELWLSTIVVHELKFGIELLPLGNRRDRIYSAITDLQSQYSDRILPVEIQRQLKPQYIAHRGTEQDAIWILEMP